LKKGKRPAHCWVDDFGGIDEPRPGIEYEFEFEDEYD
jgi:hypothetical protein